MANETTGGDLEPLAGSARSGSVHRSEDRDSTDLARDSAPNRSISSQGAAHFQAENQPVFREGSKAAQVYTLLLRPEGATLNEIRNQTGWQAHTVRGFISRNLTKQSRNVRSFERDGERAYRVKM